jgi:hypothetical protein
MVESSAPYRDLIAEAIALVREAKSAIVRGSLGYRLFVARRTTLASVPTGHGS